MEPPGIGADGTGHAPAPHRLDPPASDDLAGRLFPPLPTEVEWGLDRTRALLSELGDPHRAYPSLHVGGTNGKGSVASVWASVLRRAGRRVGLYTSPHLRSFTERFQVDGRPVSGDRLLEVAAEIGDAALRHGLTFFEASTVLALELFRREGVDVAAVEVGLGGRLDATNVLRPAVAAVTNVSLDHAEWLGDTPAAIAREKAGIVKEGVPFVTAETEPTLLEILRERARRAGAPFRRFDPAAEIRELEVGVYGSRFRMATEAWGELELATPLVGRHQAGNVGLAVRALEQLDSSLRPGRGMVREGVAAGRWPGRLQVERMEGLTWLFDVAHNEAGMAALAATLGELELPGPRVALVGVLGDKEWRRMLPPLLARVERAVLTLPPAAPAGRRWDPEAAVAALDEAPPLEVEPAFARALERARRAAGDGGSVVVTGSHHTVGGALEALGIPAFPSP